jgi:hypothetical protein
VAELGSHGLALERLDRLELLFRYVTRHFPAELSFTRTTLNFNPSANGGIVSLPSLAIRVEFACVQRVFSESV